MGSGPGPVAHLAGAQPYAGGMFGPRSGHIHGATDECMTHGATNGCCFLFLSPCPSSSPSSFLSLSLSVKSINKMLLFLKKPRESGRQRSALFPPHTATGSLCPGSSGGEGGSVPTGGQLQAGQGCGLSSGGGCRTQLLCRALANGIGRLPDEGGQVTSKNNACTLTSRWGKTRTWLSSRMAADGQPYQKPWREVRCLPPATVIRLPF